MNLIDLTPKIIGEEYYMSYSCSAADPKLSGHSHSETEIVIVSDGQFEHVYENIVITLKKNDILIIPPNTFHFLKSNRTPNNMAYVIQTHISNITFSHTPTIYQLYDDSKFILELIYKEIIENMNPFMWNDGFGSYSISGNTLTDSICKLIEVLLHKILNQKKQPINFVDSKNAFIYNQSINFMKDNLHKNLTLSDIAANAHISETAIKNIFRYSSGKGVITFFTELKIQETKKYIKSGKPISYISDVFGFSSQAYYCQVFKRITGLSPLQYKKSMY